MGRGCADERMSEELEVASQLLGNPAVQRLGHAADRAQRAAHRAEQRDDEKGARIPGTIHVNDDEERGQHPGEHDRQNE